MTGTLSIDVASDTRDDGTSDMVGRWREAMALEGVPIQNGKKKTNEQDRQEGVLMGRLLRREVLLRRLGLAFGVGFSFYFGHVAGVGRCDSIRFMVDNVVAGCCACSVHDPTP